MRHVERLLTGFFVLLIFVALVLLLGWTIRMVVQYAAYLIAISVCAGLFMIAYMIGEWLERKSK